MHGSPTAQTHPSSLMLHPTLHYPQPCPPEPPHPMCSLGGALHHSHSLEDSTLLQAVFATIPHGCIVYSLDGPVNGLEDILLQALGGGAGAGS